MRNIEIVIFILLILQFTVSFTRLKEKQWIKYLPAGMIAVLILHLILEGYRWQLYPAYLLIAVFIFVFAINRKFPKKTKKAKFFVKLRKAVQILVFTAGVSALLISVILSILFPVFELPEPSGNFHIGTTTLYMKDTSRPEYFTADPDDHRELMVQAWYPSEPVPDSKPAAYIDNSKVVTRNIAQSLELPEKLFDHVRYVNSHSYRDAPVSRELQTYPVLIFSHGFAQGFTAQNTVLMEELASIGYIIFSIGHTYESSAIVFPDGRVASYTYDSEFQNSFGDEQNAVFDSLVSASNKTEKMRLFRKIVQYKLSNVPVHSIDIWANDTRFVIDELEGMNSGNVQNLFTGHLDLDRIGAFGMSFGGACAGQVCLDDERIKAGINMDGMQYGSMIDRPLEKPFMFMYSEPDGMNDLMFDSSKAIVYRLTAAGSRHFDYTDFTFWSPVFKYSGMLGPVKADRMLLIMNVYVSSFFNKHLIGSYAPLLDGPSPDLPEVTFAVRNPVK